MLGGGVIGLSVARELAKQGWAVNLLDRGEPGKEASSAAAGMLAPSLELSAGSPLREMGMSSLALYPAFTREIEEETGRAIDLRLDGIVAPLEAPAPSGPPAPAPSGSPAPRGAPSGGNSGAVRLHGHELRGIEPALSEAVQEALFFAEEGSVDNRALVNALFAAARSRGVDVLPETAAEEVIVSGGRVRGVRTRGALFEAEVIVNCAGAWAGQIRVPGADVKVRPILGQMLCLDTGSLRGGAPRRVIYSHHAYLVPRSDGRVIVGTTVEDRGFEKAVEAAAVAKLLDGALRLCPSLAAARFVEAWAGLRPLGEAPAPRIGPAGPEGYHVAVGHYRNGILLAPLTARLVADGVAGRQGRAASPDGIAGRRPPTG